MISTTRGALAVAALLAITGCATAPKTKSLADAKSHSVTVGANRIHYVTVGSGKHTLIFVHCWSGNLDFWREQVPALADKARLVLLDLPGHGQSDKPHTAYTMDFFADAVLAVMRDAHVGKATLIGHSMGGPVICRTYSKAPEKVAALVSVDGLLRRPANVPQDKIAELLASFEKPDYRDNARQFIGSMFPVPGTEKLRDEVTSEMLATPQHVMAGAMHGMFDADQPDWDLKEVNIPVLVINAPNPMWNADYQNYVHNLSPKSEYRMMDGVGHWLMLEKPAEFNPILVELLRKYDLIGK